MPKIKFEYKRFQNKPTPAFPDQKSVTKPVIPVTFINGNKSVDVVGLVDSGAYATLLSPDLCPLLGIRLEDGKESIAVGIGGAEQKTYFHDLQIVVGGYQFNCYAGFTIGLSVELCLLGQKGFFQNFQNVSFNFNAGEIELKW